MVKGEEEIENDILPMLDDLDDLTTMLTRLKIVLLGVRIYTNTVNY